MSKPTDPTESPFIFDDTEALSAAMGKAIRAAIRRHKALGNPIAVSREGKVAIIQPEDIVVENDDDPVIAPDV